CLAALLPCCLAALLPCCLAALLPCCLAASLRPGLHLAICPLACHRTDQQKERIYSAYMPSSKSV
ncbi:hypothetical protein, partial [Aeromonas dhakensis]|uniref:hypothetical protein n=1 Tax=Aeromonas dhakensis TaxID=196024 RepID=UPI003BA1FA5A